MGDLVTPEDAVTTYRYVRLALVALVIFLAASVVKTWCHATDWQTSISAYFYTSSHSVFVAALCAVAACLVVYQGRTTTEDALLNFSGVLAFVVGLVPTGREPLRGPGLPCNFDTDLFAENSMWALLVASILIGVAVVLIQRRRPPSPKKSKVECPQELHIPAWLQRLMRLEARFLKCAEKFLPWALLIALIVGAAFFISDTDNFIEKAHGIAAFTMFGGIIAVVVHYAFYAAFRPQKRRLFAVSYACLAFAMVVTVLLAGCLHVFSGDDRPSHGVIIVEAFLILEFALFWVIQSADLWKVEEEKYWMGPPSELLEKLQQPDPPDDDASRSRLPR
jgi:hypothetical protein